MVHKKSFQIPQSFAPCFQEYRLADLDLALDHQLIIERILFYGNRQEVRWLIEHYGSQEIAEWVKQKGQRVLSHRRYTLWALLFNGAVPERRDRSPVRSSKTLWPH